MENKGQLQSYQADKMDDVLFLLHSGSVRVALRKNGLHYQFEHHVGSIIETGRPDSRRLLHPSDEVADTITIETVDIILEGANSAPQIIKQDESEYFENYYNVPSSAEGVTDVHGYGKVCYKEVYPNIDWVVYISSDRLKYDFIVHPGGKVSDIKLRINGLQKPHLLADGSLRIVTALGEIIDAPPFAYGKEDGKEIRSQYMLDGNLLGFKVGEWSGTLVIDPELIWSTYFGGAGDTYGNACAEDKRDSSVILIGRTRSPNRIATPLVFQTVLDIGLSNEYDAYVVKFKSNGQRLWGTYYGGIADDRGDACAVDHKGNVYLAGTTGTVHYMGSPGHQTEITSWAGSDAFLAKLDTAGHRIWGTYYGDNSDDVATSCVVDKDNNVILAGTTDQNGWAAYLGLSTPGAHQPNYGGGASDAFLTKFDSLGFRLWATYYGGDGDDFAYSCTTDRSDNIYLCGSTTSTTNIASSDAFDTVFSNTPFYANPDAFLVKFTSAGVRLWGTYYGGSYEDQGYSCATYKDSSVYLAGDTYSMHDIAFNGYRNTLMTVNNIIYREGFLAKFNDSGKRIWATYYGTDTSYERDNHCAVDLSGNIYLAGGTDCTAGLAGGGFNDSFAGWTDLYVAKFKPDGSRAWGAYYGGERDEFLAACASGGISGGFYITGYTYSRTGIPQNAFQDSSFANDNAFLAKIYDTVYRIPDSVIPPAVLIDNSFSETHLCVPVVFSLPYHIDQVFNPGNVLTAQLSDGLGLFTNPLNIGSVAAIAGNGVIPCTLSSNLAPGIHYRIRIVASDPPDTSLSNAFDISLGVTTSPSVTIALLEEHIDCNGGDAKFIASVTGGSSNSIYQWVWNGLNAGTNDSFYSGNSFRIGDKIQCRITSSDSCASPGNTISNEIILNGSCCEVYLPGGFSPNGDGNNDVFRMITHDTHEISAFRIYNRWGQQIFSASDQWVGWDGKYHGQLQPIGTYYYTLKYRCLSSDQTFEKKGNFILLR